MSDKKRNFESSSLRVKLFVFGLSGITHNVQIYIIHGFCIASLGKLMHGAFSAEKMNKLSIPYACSFFECQTKTQLSDKKTQFRMLESTGKFVRFSIVRHKTQFSDLRIQGFCIASLCKLMHGEFSAENSSALSEIRQTQKQRTALNIFKNCPSVLPLKTPFLA